MDFSNLVVLFFTRNTNNVSHENMEFLGYQTKEAELNVYRNRAIIKHLVQSKTSLVVTALILQEGHYTLPSVHLSPIISVTPDQVMRRAHTDRFLGSASESAFSSSEPLFSTILSDFRLSSGS